MPTGWWALAMRPGGAGWPVRRCTPGAGRKGPCGWKNSRPKKTIRTPKPSAATGCCGPTPTPSGCASCKAGRLARSPKISWALACERLAAEGRKALLLIWDNAAWHHSRRVRAWIRAHNRRVKREGGVRIVVCALPIKSPWLNRIEPYWVHGKRAILEADRKLTAAETVERVCAYFGCENFPPLAQQLN